MPPGPLNITAFCTKLKLLSEVGSKTYAWSTRRRHEHSPLDHPPVLTVLAILQACTTLVRIWPVVVYILVAFFRVFKQSTFVYGHKLKSYSVTNFKMDKKSPVTPVRSVLADESLSLPAKVRVVLSFRILVCEISWIPVELMSLVNHFGMCRLSSVPLPLQEIRLEFNSFIVELSHTPPEQKQNP